MALGPLTSSVAAMAYTLLLFQLHGIEIGIDMIRNDYRRINYVTQHIFCMGRGVDINMQLGIEFSQFRQAWQETRLLRKAAIHQVASLRSLPLTVI